MFFKQFYEPRLAQYSYMIACPASGEALVVDPLRDIDMYLAEAEAQRVRITHVTETHIHADFLSGARALAEAAGADLLLSDEGGEDWQYAFPHTGLKHGDSFRVGHVRIDALHTPGHTPEHLAFLITDTLAGEDPAMILTGDFVFVGDVGRPDLLDLAAGVGGTSQPMARRMFASLQMFRQLPDHVVLWPGHGAGSACGRALGASPASTVGYEKRTNWALQEEDEEAFVLKLLVDQPMPPAYFRNMKLWNRSGEKPGGGPVQPPRLPIQRLETLRDQGAVLVDTRDKSAFAAGHIPGSIHIPDNALFPTWAGWLLDPDTPAVLIAPEAAAPDLVTSLYRIGLDQVAGYFVDVHYWAQMGRELARLEQMNAAELAEALAAKRAVAVDVREPHELRNGFIPGAIAISAGKLLRAAIQPDTDRALVFYCGRGDRAAIIASHLQRQGFAQVMTLREGVRGWEAAGLSLEAPDADIDFEQVDALEAYRRQTEAGWTIIDVRDDAAFRRGHPVGARLVPLDSFVDDAVIASLRALEPLLLICNTGNKSAMAAEWLLSEGVTRIANVEGGVIGWQLHHLPWEK